MCYFLVFALLYVSNFSFIEKRYNRNENDHNTT